MLFIFLFVLLEEHLSPFRKEVETQAKEKGQLGSARPTAQRSTRSRSTISKPAD